MSAGFGAFILVLPNLDFVVISIALAERRDAGSRIAPFLG